MTYKAVGRSIINYAAPVWSTNLRDTKYRNIKYTQNEALRIATGGHKMSSLLLSCHLTAFFHLSTHFLSFSLNF